MEENKDTAAMPEEVTDGEREEKTVESAADAASSGTEGEGKTGEEKSEENVACEKDPEPDPGQDPVAEPQTGESPDKEEPKQEEPKKEKGGIFRTKKELQKKDEEIAELRDQLLRARAEFDNFRKRTEKEKAVRFDDGAMYILLKLLPVVDNFERGLAQVPEEAKDDPYVTGLEKIYKQVTALLEECSVTPIESVGKEFNPELHNAVMHVDDEELGENIVAEEFQKGYSYKDHVLRHSMVKVAN